MLLKIENFVGDKKSSKQISMRKIGDKIVFQSGKELIFSVSQKGYSGDNRYICRNLLSRIISSKTNRDGMTMETLLKQHFFYLYDHYICEYNENYL